MKDKEKIQAMIGKEIMESEWSIMEAVGIQLKRKLLQVYWVLAGVIIALGLLVIYAIT